jgi:calcineurin-like phosphoesterase family protein
VRFFTSDLHFGHKNIIEYCNRPWKTVDEMNYGLVQRWNQVVGDEDEVWILGDHAFGGATFIRTFTMALRGRKHLLRGNHDWKNIKPTRLDLGFETIVDGVRDIWLSDPPLRWTMKARMCHFPFRGAHPTDHRYEEMKPEDDGGVLLHGHVHKAWKAFNRQINVGVDVWDWRPVPESAIVALIRDEERARTRARGV